MATADELLANELNAEDAWCEIDLQSRQIIIPNSISNLGTKSEADVVHVKFRLPRFYNDIDFADFEIGIDYTNAQGEEDRYEPKNVTVDDDAVTFTWIVGRHAALYDGTVTFGLCAKRPNPDNPSDPLNEFHTTKTSLPILDSMETCEEAVLEYTDLLEQWRAELFGKNSDEDYLLRYDEQTLTEEQKAQARANIDAADKTEVDALDSTLLERINPCVIDENTPMENGYLDSNGAFIEKTGNYHATDFIELEQGVKYIGEVSCVAGGSINTVPRSVRFYNADKVFTRTLSMPADWDNIVLKNDEKYIRLDVVYDDGTLEYLRVYPELKGYKDILTLNKDIGVPQISITEEELEGIRKGYDGTIYETAGEAVRAQIHEVSNDVLELCTKEKWNLAEDATIEYKKRCVSQWQTIGEPITTATDKACFIVVLDVSALQGKGLHFISEKYANAYSGNGYNGKIASYHICFADADGNFIGGKSYPQPGINGYIVPDNAKSCYITFTTTDDLEVADDLSNIGYYWVTAKGQDEHFDILTLNPEMKVPQLDEEISRVYKDLGGEQVHAPYIHARRPVIGFIFDGDNELNAEFENLFYSNGICIGFAPQYTTGFANNSKQTYLDWQEKGHEILAHGSVVLNETTTYTDEEAVEIIKASHATLTGYGFKVHGLIGSNGAIAERFLPTVKSFYDYAATKNNHSATYTYSELASESCLFFNTDNPYKLWRYGMSDATLDQLKAAVDRAISQCGLLLFYDHARTTYWDEAGIAKLGDLIAYIKEKNVSVKTPYEAIKDYYSIRYEDIINQN